jgi:chemotaxis protein histidine kinase CheA
VTFDPAEFLDEFRSEASEHLRKLDQHLLALERDPADEQPIRQMFLSAHTIKGGAAMLELAGVRELAHALEDVLAQLRDTPRRLDTATADLLFRAVDALQTLVEGATPRGAVEPVSAELARALRQHARELSAPPGAPEPGQTPRALVVDESATVRLLETMVLSEVGFEVDAVDDGQRALAMATTTPYRLVVTGLQNRGLDGLALLLALRENTIPVIVTSSDDSPEPRRRATELGAYAFLARGSLADPALAGAARDVLQGAVC